MSGSFVRKLHQIEIAKPGLSPAAPAQPSAPSPFREKLAQIDIAQFAAQPVAASTQAPPPQAGPDPRAAGLTFPAPEPGPEGLAGPVRPEYAAGVRQMSPKLPQEHLAAAATPASGIPAGVPQLPAPSPGTLPPPVEAPIERANVEAMYPTDQRDPAAMKFHLGAAPVSGPDFTRIQEYSVLDSPARKAVEFARGTIRSATMGVGDLAGGVGRGLEWMEVAADPKMEDDPRAEKMRQKWEKERGLPPGSYMKLHDDLSVGKHLVAFADDQRQKFPVDERLGRDLAGHWDMLLDPAWWAEHGPRSAVISAPFYLSGTAGYKIMGEAGAVAASVISEAWLEGAFVYGDLRSKGVSPAEASRKAAITFAINVPITLLPAEELFGGEGRSFGRRLLGVMFAEGAQETNQQVTSNLATGEPWGAGVAESGVMGAAMGVGMGAATGGLRAEPAPPTEAPPARAPRTARPKVAPAPAAAAEAQPVSQPTPPAAGPTAPAQPTDLPVAPKPQTQAPSSQTVAPTSPTQAELEAPKPKETHTLKLDESLSQFADEITAGLKHKREGNEIIFETEEDKDEAMIRVLEAAEKKLAQPPEEATPPEEPSRLPSQLADAVPLLEQLREKRHRVDAGDEGSADLLAKLWDIYRGVHKDEAADRTALKKALGEYGVDPESVTVAQMLRDEEAPAEEAPQEPAPEGVVVPEPAEHYGYAPGTADAEAWKKGYLEGVTGKEKTVTAAIPSAKAYHSGYGAGWTAKLGNERAAAKAKAAQSAEQHKVGDRIRFTPTNKIYKADEGEIVEIVKNQAGETGYVIQTNDPEPGDTVRRWVTRGSTEAIEKPMEPQPDESKYDQKRERAILERQSEIAAVLDRLQKNINAAGTKNVNRLRQIKERDALYKEQAALKAELTKMYFRPATTGPTSETPVEKPAPAQPPLKLAQDRDALKAMSDADLFALGVRVEAAPWRKGSTHMALHDVRKELERRDYDSKELDTWAGNPSTAARPRKADAVEAERAAKERAGYREPTDLRRPGVVQAFEHYKGTRPVMTDNPAGHSNGIAWFAPGSVPKDFARKYAPESNSQRLDVKQHQNWQPTGAPAKVVFESPTGGLGRGFIVLEAKGNHAIFDLPMFSYVSKSAPGTQILLERALDKSGNPQDGFAVKFVKDGKLVAVAMSLQLKEAGERAVDWWYKSKGIERPAVSESAGPAKAAPTKEKGATPDRRIKIYIGSKEHEVIFPEAASKVVFKLATQMRKANKPRSGAKYPDTQAFDYAIAQVKIAGLVKHLQMSTLAHTFRDAVIKATMDDEALPTLQGVWDTLPANIKAGRPNSGFLEGETVTENSSGRKGVVEHVLGMKPLFGGTTSYTITVKWDDGKTSSHSPGEITLAEKKGPTIIGVTEALSPGLRYRDAYRNWVMRANAEPRPNVPKGVSVTEAIRIQKDVDDEIADKNKSAAAPEKPAQKGKLIPYRGPNGETLYRTEAAEEGPAAAAPPAEKPGLLSAEEQATVDAEAAKIKKFFEDQAKGIKPSTGVPIEVLGSLGKIGTIYVKAGLRSFRAWSAKMLETVGEGAREYLKATWQLVKRRNADLAATMQDDNFQVGGTIPAEEKPNEGATGRAGAEDKGTLEGVPPEDVPGTGGLGAAEEGAAGSPRDDRGGDLGTREPGTEPGAGEGTDIPPVGVPPGGGGAANLPHHPSLDYRFSQGDIVTGDRSRANANLAAIKLLVQIEAEGRRATANEQAILAKYSGWGSIKGPFDPSYVKEEWRGMNEELKKLLTPEEMEAIASSTRNAHYTAPGVVEAIWNGIRRLGVGGAVRVLEPSMGVGYFLGMMPADIAAGSSRIGIEKDSVTGRLAKQLFQASNIHVAPFEGVRLPNDYFDLVVSNFPFGRIPVVDPRYRSKPFLRASIHNYFFARSLDIVRPGGLVVAITSSFTMDAKSEIIRKYLDGKADLIGAIRLPDTAFKKNAGTEVVTDILFLRKRGESEKPSGEVWRSLGVTKTEKGEDIGVNEYYIKHPEMLLGKMSYEGTQYGKNTRTMTGDLTPEILAEAISRLPQDVFTVPTPEELAPATTIASWEVDPKGTVKPGGFKIHEGRAVRRVGDAFVDAEMGKDAVKNLVQQLAIRDALNEVYRTQIQGDPKDVQDEARGELNKIYDAFVKKYGYLHTKENLRIMDGDPDQHRVTTIERWDSETKVGTKAPVFSKPTLAKYTPPERADSPAHALAISLSETNSISWPRIAALLDKPVDLAQVELAGHVFRNPDGEKWEPADEYLSGNVRWKLEQAKAALDLDEKYKANVDALEAVQPDDKPPGSITIRLGASWVPKEDIKAFAAHILNDDHVDITHVESSAEWGVHFEGATRSAENISLWGTRRQPAYKLIDKGLNLRVPTVYDPDGSGGRVLNVTATTAAREKLDAIKAEFLRWIWSDNARTDRLVRLFNDQFNSERDRVFDGSHVVLHGASDEITLDPHQKDAIWRIMQTGKAMLGHVVGGGKTYSLIGASMEMKRLGTMRKPLFNIKKGLIPQFADMFRALYPGANLLIAGPKDFDKANRQRFFGTIAAGDWDAVIMSREQFFQLPVSDEAHAAFLREQLEEIERALLAARESEGDKSNAVAALQDAYDRAKAKLDNLLVREKKDQGLTFEEMGIDGLLVDEFQDYKNLYFPSKMNRVPGVPSSNTKRSTDMLVKSQIILRANNNRNFVTATGTPLSNSLTEIYTLQKYLQLDVLRELGMEAFDSWAATFGEAVMDWEPMPEDVTRLRLHTRFAQFSNLSAMLSMLYRVADLKPIEKLPHLLAVRPKVKGGAPEVAAVEAGPALMAFVRDELGPRAIAIRSGAVDKSDDNMLVVTNDGRLAALDIRLVKPRAPEEPTSKANAIVARVLKIYKEHTKAVMKDGEIFHSENATQAVFLDRFTSPGRTDLHIHNELIKKLVKAGIPREQIASIWEATTDDKLRALQTRVNEGKVRVILGSSDTLGVGKNIQRKLIAVHNGDASWTPKDIEQREGRGLRQGNENKEIYIINYVTKPSFDAYMWGTVQRKAGFISDVMHHQVGVESARDVDESYVNAAVAAAEASGNPLVGELQKVNQQLAALERSRAAHIDTAYNNRSTLASSRSSLDSRSDYKDRIEADIIKRDATKGLPPTLHLGAHTFADMKDPKIQELLDKAAEYAQKQEHGHEQQIGEYRGFPLWVRTGAAFVIWVDRKTGEPVSGVGLDLEKHKSARIRHVTLSLKGRAAWDAGEKTVASFEATLNRSMESTLENTNKDIREDLERAEKIEKIIDAPWPKEAEFGQLTRRLSEIEQELSLNRGDTQAQQQDDSDDDEDDGDSDAYHAREGADEGTDFEPFMAYEAKEDAEEIDPREGTQSEDVLAPNYFPPEPGSEAAKNIKSRYEIIKDLEKGLNVPIRLGRVGGPKRRLGIFKVKPEVIRIRLAPDVEAASHEVGHKLYKKIFKRADLRPHRADLLALAQTQPKPNVNEGLGEFVRLYITDRAQLDQYPELVQMFEKVMTERFPEGLRALQIARADWERWLAAPASARILSEISIDPKKQRSLPDMHAVYTDWVDRLHPIKVVEEAMNDGKPLPDEASSYVAHQVLSNWVGKAEMWIQKRRASFADPLDGVGESFEAIFDDLAWKDRDDFIVFMIGKSAQERIKNGLQTPWDEETIKEALKEQASPKFEALFKRVREYEDDLIQYVADAGGLSDEQLDKIREMNRQHIPFYRVMEVQGGRAYSIGATVDLATPVKRQHGSARQIIDPIESIFYNTFGLIHWAEKNYAASLLFDQAEKTHGAGVWIERISRQIKPTQVAVAEVLEKAGLSKYLDEAETDVVTLFRPSLFETDPNVVAHWRKGEQFFYKVHPALKIALSGADRDVPLDFKFLRLSAASLRATATVTLGFSQRNPLRDQFTAWFNTKYGFVPGVDWFRGVYHVLGETDTYWDAKAAGGLHSLMVSMDRDYISKAARHALRPHWKSNLREFANPLSILQAISSVGEEATRVMEVTRALKAKGRSRAGATAAGYAGQEVTVPFQKGGASPKAIALRRIAAFFNAGIVGLDKTGRQFKDRPIRTTLRVFAGITLPSIILWLLHKDEDWYKQKPRWERDLYWFITPTIRIPKPFEVGIIFGSMVERWMEAMQEDDEHAWDQALDTILTSLPMPFPTGLLPLVENITNYSFFYGRHIDQETGSQPPPQFRDTPYTSEAARQLGLILGVSPNKIENLVRGYTAGIGMSLLHAPETLGVPGRGGERPTMTIPERLFPGFVSRSPSFNAEPIEQFYRGYIQSQQAAALHSRMKKSGHTPEGDAYLDTVKYDESTAKHYREAAEDMGKLRRKANKVRADSSLTGDEKRARLDELALKVIRIAEKANRYAERKR